MNLGKAQHFIDRTAWRTWLQQNHTSSKELWLVHYRKSSGKTSVPHREAVEEALCFGWIDSTLKKIDEERFILRYTPRKAKSVWSKINKEKAEQLITQGLMTDAGTKKIEEAKRHGLWDTAYTNKKKERLPSDLKTVLMKNQQAWKNFQAFANSYRNMYIGWVQNAKTDTTRKRRIREVVQRSLRNIKPGVPASFLILLMSIHILLHNIPSW
ncbi:MAG: YdeI/OmpD-associated family protein [Methanobacteriota archaeon]